MRSSSFLLAFGCVLWACAPVLQNRREALADPTMAPTMAAVDDPLEAWLDCKLHSCGEGTAVHRTYELDHATLELVRRLMEG